MNANSITGRHTLLAPIQLGKIIAWLFVLVIFCGDSRADELSDTIRNAICSSYGKIQTLQFVQSIKTQLPNLPQPTCVCEMFVEGKCFYSSSKVRNNFVEHSFDGSVFSKLSLDELIIYDSSKGPHYGIHLPQSLAMSWLNCEPKSEP